MKVSGDPELPARVSAEGSNGDFDPATSAMLAHAEKLTLHLDQMEEADMIPLREAGLSDEDILDLTMVTAYYGYMNRIASGLGAQVHPLQEDPTKTA